MSPARRRSRLTSTTFEKFLQVLLGQLERRFREQDVDERLRGLKRQLPLRVSSRLRGHVGRISRDLGPLLALAAALEQVADRLDEVLVVEEISRLNNPGREIGKFSLVDVKHRVGLQRRGDFVSLRQIRVETLRAQ